MNDVQKNPIAEGENKNKSRSISLDPVLWKHVRVKAAQLDMTVSRFFAKLIELDKCKNLIKQ